MAKYHDKGWTSKRDGSGGLFGGKHVPPKGRDPRPKGSQRGVTRRDGQNGLFNTGSKRGFWR